MSSLNILKLAEQNALHAELAVAGGSSVSATTPSSSSGFYTSHGRNSTNNPKVKNKRKAFIAGGVIAALLIGGFVFLGSSNALLPGAISALFTEATDSQYTSYYLRVPELQQYMLENNGQENPISDKYSNVSSYFESRLNQYNMEIDDSNNIIWHHPLADGSVEDITVSASEFSERYNNDVSFRSDYLKAKRGRVATFFDETADTTYNHLGLSRNWFSEYKQTHDSTTDMENYQSTMSSKFDNDSATYENGSQDWEIICVKRNIFDDCIEYELRDGRQSNSVSNRATSDSSQLLESIQLYQKSGGAGLSQNCAQLKLSNNLAATNNALLRYSSIKTFTGGMENISKMMAGDGDAAATNAFLNSLTTSSTTTVIDPTTGEEVELKGSALESEGMRGILSNTTINTSQTQYFSIDAINQSLNANYQGYSPSQAISCEIESGDVSNGLSAITTEYDGMGGTMVGGQIFTNAKSDLGNNWSQVSSGYENFQAGWSSYDREWSFFGSIFDFFKGWFGNLFASTGQLAVSAVEASLETTLSFLIPSLNQVLYDNYYSSLSGIALGEVFTRGAYAANTAISTYGSAQTASSTKAVKTFAGLTNTVLAMEAEVDRANHSPFDITNKNTFFGSIAYTLLPSLTSSQLTSATSLIRSTSSSLASLLGNQVFASNSINPAYTNYTSYQGKGCVQNDELGIASDPYCNPLVTTDPSTIHINPNDPTYQSVILANLDSNKQIKRSSRLQKFVDVCVNRDSPLGVFDTNLFARIGGNITQNEGASGHTGHTQWGSAFMNILNNVKYITSEIKAWVTGSICRNSADNPDWDSEIKYYQRYVEDMRLLDQFDPNAEHGNNAVLAYTKQSYAENPINTTSDLIASLTGMTKQDADTVIAVLDIYNTIKNYDPSTRIAFTDLLDLTLSGEQVTQNFKDTTPELGSVNTPLVAVVDIASVVSKNTIYSDLRNRSYAIS